MLLGFKRRFAPYVEEGSKTHTIRRKKKYPPKPGETCHCYVDPRQRSMQLLGRFRCTRVQDIRIDRPDDWMMKKIPLTVTIDDLRLSADEADALFYRDGFRESNGVDEFRYLRQAARFWANGEFPFHGDVVHWEYKPGTAAPDSTVKRIVEVTARLNAESKALRRQARGER